MAIFGPCLDEAMTVHVCVHNCMKMFSFKEKCASALSSNTCHGQVTLDSGVNWSSHIGNPYNL